MYNKEEFLKLQELMKRQEGLLQLVIQGKPLSLALNVLIDWIEEQSSQRMIASILCVDQTGRRLQQIAGKGLPQTFIEAIDNLPIGSKSGSCGTAAYTGKTVFVENISEHPFWENYREAALKNNLHACWSEPLINAEGKVRGTFAVYYTQPKLPSEDDLQLIAMTAHTALLLIEFRLAEEERDRKNERQKQISESLKKSEQRFQNLIRQATIGMVVLRGKEMIVDVVNEMYGELINTTPEELLNKPLFDIIPEAADPFRPMLEKVMATGEPLYLYDHPYTLFPNGKKKQGYLNVVYQPYREFDGTITGVMALCHDVTEIVLSKKKVEESEANFKNLIMQAPVAIAVFQGENFIAEIVNDTYLPPGRQNEGSVCWKTIVQGASGSKRSIGTISKRTGFNRKAFSCK